MRLAPVLALGALVCLPVSRASAQDGTVLFKPPEKELRGVTLRATDGVFASQAQIAKALEAFADARVNVIFPCVWDGAYTLWHSPTAKQAFGADCDPAFGERDVLSEVLFEAHRVGLEVVPCFEAGFTAKGALLDKHPEWAALGRDGKPLVLGGERWVDALDPAAQQFYLDLVLELVRNYDVDGIAGSERFPALPAEALPKPAQRELYLKAGSGSSTDPKDKQWCAWRTQQLTEFAARVSGGLNPALLIVLAPHLSGAGPSEWLQDPAAWIERKCAHELCLCGETQNAEAESKRLDALLGDAWYGKHLTQLCTGVATSSKTWKADAAFVQGAAKACRAKKLAGIVFGGARELLENDAALAQALADEPWDYPMIPPWRDAEGWRPKPVETRPQAGSGKWQFPSSDGPMVMTLDGGLAGEASWTARVPIAGAYDVYTWIAPDQNLGEIAKYKLAAKNGLQTIQLRVGPAAMRGWRRVGEVRLPENEEFEVARFDAIEKDGTKVSAVGPLLLLYDRMGSRR